MTKTNVKFTYFIVIVNFLTQILRDKLPQLIFDNGFLIGSSGIILLLMLSKVMNKLIIYRNKKVKFKTSPFRIREKFTNYLEYCRLGNCITCPPLDP